GLGDRTAGERRLRQLRAHRQLHHPRQPYGDGGDRGAAADGARGRLDLGPVPRDLRRGEEGDGQLRLLIRLERPGHRLSLDASGLPERRRVPRGGRAHAVDGHGRGDRGLAFGRRWYSDGLVSPSNMSKSGGGHVDFDLFTTGQVGMALTNPEAIANFDEAMPGEWGSAPMIRNSGEA